MTRTTSKFGHFVLAEHGVVTTVMYLGKFSLTRSGNKQWLRQGEGQAASGGTLEPLLLATTVLGE